MGCDGIRMEYNGIQISIDARNNMEYDRLYLGYGWNTMEYTGLCIEPHRIKWNTYGICMI